MSIAAQGGQSVDDLELFARSALAEGNEEAALPRLLAAADTSGNARLWQWAGLLLRSIDEHERAMSAFRTAARIAPADPGIARGSAQVAFEAGEDSVHLFEVARSLAPQEGSVHLGLAASRVAAGRADLAIAELEALLRQTPAWIEGHLQLAQIRAFAGAPGGTALALEQAIQRSPAMTELYLALCALRLRKEDYRALKQGAERGLATGRLAREFAVYRAIAAGELSEEIAEQLLSATAVEREPGLAIWRIRHLIRQGRIAEALPAIDRELQSDRARFAWPYAAVAWRLGKDGRCHWLEDERLIRIMDLRAGLGDLDEIAECLRGLHGRAGQYIEQSVRGGSQTDGPLLSRTAAPIRRLRQSIVAAVEDYVRGLPPADEKHPLLAPRRDRRVRFSGSWSVRLRGGGHHTSHVHPEGWISSALYIALPPIADTEPKDAGWLTFGEPPADLKAGLDPYRTVEPTVGQLVLFPSYVWHGTRPFEVGERLTVAFDVAPPT